MPNIQSLTLPQIITAVGGLGTAAFGLVDSTRALGGGVNHIGFGGIRHAVTPLTSGTALSVSESDTYARFDRIVTAILDEAWQRADHKYTSATRFIAMIFLGARVLLETVAHMSLPVRRAVIMAGAIDDNCLDRSFSAGILTEGHPWWRAALGHHGPSKPRPANLRAPFEIPDNWKYGHGNYLEVDSPPPAPIATPIDVPPNGTPPPAGGTTGWQEAWSAAFASTRFK